ncbi:putative sugar hydrolase [Vararia minispora EC-137]|uniref:Sugar hydrolase n=1 Tax=Vararia minispora EC-137 TaxID=1314806 RepID=A0ACB8Q6V0_9AGAM|nr:putative sugar hydrolase [Vararia minispora EC-137]
MVKFTRGMWTWAEDTVINWAIEAVKSEAKTSSIRAVVTTRHIYHRGDTLNTPSITFECSSPLPDTLLLTGYHWKGQTSSNLDGPVTWKTDTTLTLSTTTLSAVIDTTPSNFSVDIRSYGVPAPTSISSTPSQRLTRLGWRSVGYVKQGANDHPNKAMVDPDAGKRWMTFQFDLAVGEKVYGLGERFGPFVKNGQSIETWNEDGGTSSEYTYKNVPFYMSSRGYGIFVSSPGAVSFEVQSERTTRVNIAVPFESLSVYLIHGPSPAQIIERYTLLTGRPALPPAWSFGLWLTTSFTTNYDEKTVNSFLEGMQERDIPVAVFHYDCFWMKNFEWCNFEFDPDFFPDAARQLKRLKDKGYKICVWINPYIAQESKLFAEGAEHGYFIKKQDGSVWQWDWWQAGMALVDFTNPAAWSWYQSHLSRLVSLGVDVFKTDFGERIPTGNTVYHDGSSAEKMHNFYSFLYNKCTFELLEKELGKNEALVFARSATAGGQRFPVHWGGDPMSTFEAMAETLRGGMSLGLCGFGYWAHDIGGFEGTPDPALYKRWFAFGALSSHSRLHGSGSFRVPWVIDPSGEADVVLRTFVHLKHRLMPYIYAAAVRTHSTGVPLMRPLFVEFPSDPAAWNVDTQYMLGPALLVAPVFSAEGDVQFYVPEGKWYGVIDGKVRKGPAYVVEKHGFKSIPLLLRPGAAIVMGNERIARRAVYDYADGVTVLVNSSTSIDTEIVLPDSGKAGEAAATLRVTGRGDAGKVRVEVLSGAVKGEWRMRVAGGGKLREVSAEGKEVVEV